MKKEIFFAIIAGSAFGLLIASGVWYANSFLKPKNNNSTISQKRQTPIPSQEENFKIVVATPSNMSILTETPAVISGITKPKAYVVISNTDSDNITNASDSGSFNSNIDLTGGINQVQLNAFDSGGNQTHTNVLLIYSSQFTLPQATTPGKGIAYIGTVTDISNSVIQIKTDNGNIQQISEDENTAFIDGRNDTTKQIKATDVAIGDYLVGMGIKDGNNILNASRILITDAPKPVTLTAIFGLVTDDKGINKFVAKNIKTGETMTFTPATRITVSGSETKFGNISNNEKFIAAGFLKDGIFAARTILVVK